MPIFSYNCQKCNNEFELLVGVTADKADLECPKCFHLIAFYQG